MLAAVIHKDHPTHLSRVSYSSLFGALLALSGCGDDSDHTHASHSTTAATHDSHDTTSDTHDTHDTTGDTHDTDTHGDTDTHDSHDSHDSTSDSDGSTTADSDTDGYTPPSAAEYCECMLEHCHDLYHATWGEDHIESEAMCTASAESAPVAGEPAMSGDSIECRMHFCQFAADHADESACDNALGGGVCQ